MFHILAAISICVRTTKQFQRFRREPSIDQGSIKYKFTKDVS